MGKWFITYAAGLLAAALIMVPTVSGADQTTYEYDPMGRLTQVVSVSAEAIFEAGYLYDDAGNRTDRIIARLVDTDSDGIPDDWENQFVFLDPENPHDALLDYDRDGLSNVGEYLHSTDPSAADSDGDGHLDGAEVIAGTDPTDPLTSPLPIISGVLPQKGSIRGQSEVLITGNNFSGVNSVMFGDVEANSFMVHGITQIIAYSPRFVSLPLEVDISVTNSAGSNFDTSADDFTYVFYTSYDGIDLAATVNFDAGGGPYAITFGDFDGDGKTDIATGNYDSSSISVMRNISSAPGEIAFDTPSIYDSGGAPHDICYGDFNGDGKMDLATANFGSGDTSVFINMSSGPGDISFAEQVRFNAGRYSRGVTAGDFDGDGKTDLAVANYYTDDVSVLLNTSTLNETTFADKIDFNSGNGSTDVTIGDFNGDGKTDLAVSNSSRRRSNKVSILLNDSSSPGHISFEPKRDFSTARGPYGICFGDFDGDGQTDLATANTAADSISVIRNTSSGSNLSFDDHITYSTGDYPFGICAGDFDGNGRTDLAVANYYSDNISLFLNTSPGIGTISFADQNNFATAIGPHGISLGDFDGDGKTDIVTGNYDSSNITVLRNTTGE